MRRTLATATLPLLLGLPWSISASLGVGAASLLAGAYLLAGIVRSSLSYATTGATFSLFALSLALWESSSSPDVFATVLFGVALLTLVELVHQDHRFARVPLRRDTRLRYVRWWLCRTGIIVATALVLAASGTALPLPLSTIGHLSVAAVGVLIAFGAAVAFAWPRHDDR